MDTMNELRTSLKNIQCPVNDRDSFKCYRNSNSFKEIKVVAHTNKIVQELEHVSRNPSIKRIKNVLDSTLDSQKRSSHNEFLINQKADFNRFYEYSQESEEAPEVILNPCLGNPANRTVCSGSFMSEKAFLKPTDVYYKSPEEAYQKAGPRLHIALKPSETVIAISTSGGLCPGLNVVIRELVMSAWYNYGVRKIYGIKWGYEGAVDLDNFIELTPLRVRDIHREGGTILGTCRCQMNPEKIVDNLLEKNINVFFSIGGDGTHRGIKAISEELAKRDAKIILAGVPKTIDNDIPLIDKSFGFETAIQQAVNVIQVANVEANSTKNGIGLVRLFGRHCGFIALEASKASRDVNVCLIPESSFNLYGEKGLLTFIFNRLEIKNHCVIVVAEGAASSILDYKVKETVEKDKSGNLVLTDIGDILKKEIKEYAKENGVEATLKYVDPTYIIRGCPANSFDINYCAQLAQNAIHCVFGGYTEFTVGFINNQPVMIPLDHMISLGKRKIDTEMDLEYLSLMASTGQASFK